MEAVTMVEADVLKTALHTLHVILAGVWLGGLLFTTAVVSPALKEMNWPEAERVRVRSIIGRHYARVGGANLVLLLVFAVLDGLIAQELGPVFYAEYALMVVLFGLATAHSAYLGRRLTLLAESERKAPGAEEAAKIAQERRSLGKLSLRVSETNLVVSTAVAILAASA
jgi:putative copper export protein